jgi:hypothetical protein
MRPLLFPLAFLLAAIGFGLQAQLPDPGETETPGDAEGGGTVVCETCCQTTAEFICAREGCICSEDEPTWCFGVASVASVDSPPRAPLRIGRQFSAVLDRYEDTDLGRRYAEALARHDARLLRIHLAEPDLARRTGAALLEHWPSRPREAGPVTEDAVAAARAILAGIAEADRRLGSEGLASLIEEDVLPRLRPGLAGRPVPEALDCFMGQGC